MIVQSASPGATLIFVARLDYSDAAALEQKRSKVAAARQRYVEGYADPNGVHVWPSRAECAAHVDLPTQTVSARARREDWDLQRDAYRSAFEARQRQERLVERVQEAVAAERRTVASVLGSLTLVARRVEEITEKSDEALAARERYQEAKARGASEVELAETGYDPWTPPVIDAREMSALAGTVEKLWGTLGKALGIERALEIEVSGPGGGPIEVEHSVVAELTRDDPNRLLGLFLAMERAKVAAKEQAQIMASGEVVEGEVV